MTQPRPTDHAATAKRNAPAPCRRKRLSTSSKWSPDGVFRRPIIDRILSMVVHRTGSWSPFRGRTSKTSGDRAAS